MGMDVYGRAHRSEVGEYFRISVDNVKEFIAFLKECGGFKIC